MLQCIFLRLKGIQALGFVDQFTGIGKQHCVTIKGDSYLAFGDLRSVGWRRLEDGRSTLPGVDHLLRIVYVGGEKQINIESIHVVRHRLAIGECRARDRRLVPANGLEYMNLVSELLRDITTTSTSGEVSSLSICRLRSSSALIRW